jgi:hypothetical protein
MQERPAAVRELGLDGLGALSPLRAFVRVPGRTTDLERASCRRRGGSHVCGPHARARQ